MVDSRVNALDAPLEPCTSRPIANWEFTLEVLIFLQAISSF